MGAIFFGVNRFGHEVFKSGAERAHSKTLSRLRQSLNFRKVLECERAAPLFGDVTKWRTPQRNSSNQ
jgi:hypothetical protein